jgi:hypothetical protein
MVGSDGVYFLYLLIYKTFSCTFAFIILYNIFAIKKNSDIFVEAKHRSLIIFNALEFEMNGAQKMH